MMKALWLLEPWAPSSPVVCNREDVRSLFAAAGIEPTPRWPE